MQKLITSFLSMFFLVGLTSTVNGQAAGDFVFTQPASTDSTMATLGNWSVSDGAGGLTAATRLPICTDNVWIPAGKNLGVIPATASSTASMLTAGSTTMTLSAASTSILPGMVVRPKENAAITYGIAPGTYVVSVSGTTVTLSNPATHTFKGDFTFVTAVKNLNIAGNFFGSAPFAVMGDITVAAGARVMMNTDLYCKNIINNGIFNASTNVRSGKNLFIGFDGAVPGTGEYAITNDGRFGHSVPVIPSVNGSGIIVLYSNQASKFAVKASSPNIAGTAFNIAAILPHNNNKTTANTTLEIKQSMSLLRHNGMGLSVQNNDSSLNTNRVCTIDPGVTVYVGYRFHTNGGVTTNPQGNVTYNVYGTLDMATYPSFSNNSTAAAANTSDFGLNMTTTTGNTGTLTFNLGDGTQANAGTLILGSNVKIIKQRGQTLNFNISDYSTVIVKGNLGWTMNYQLLNSNVPALYLFPKSFYNLTLDGAKALIPVKPIVRGAYTKTTHGYGVTNWVAADLTGVTPTTIATSLYVAATGLPQGSVMYTGSAYYYVPVVQSTSSYASGTNPITIDGDSIMSYIAIDQYSSTTSGAKVTAVSGNAVTLSVAPTPTNPVVAGKVSFTAIQGTTAPTGISTPTAPVFDGAQPLIYLGDATFADKVVSGVNTVENGKSAFVYSNEKNTIQISNAAVNDIVNVYSISGMRVSSMQLKSEKGFVKVPSGVYVVKVNNVASKVIVK